MAWKGLALYFYAFLDLIATTQGLNNLIACRQSDGAIIQTNIFNKIQP